MYQTQKRETRGCHGKHDRPGAGPPPGPVVAWSETMPQREGVGWGRLAPGQSCSAEVALLPFLCLQALLQGLEGLGVSLLLEGVGVGGRSGLPPLEAHCLERGLLILEGLLRGLELRGRFVVVELARIQVL